MEAVYLFITYIYCQWLRHSGDDWQQD